MVLSFALLFVWATGLVSLPVQGLEQFYQGMNAKYVGDKLVVHYPHVLIVATVDSRGQIAIRTGSDHSNPEFLVYLSDLTAGTDFPSDKKSDGAIVFICAPVGKMSGKAFHDAREILLQPQLDEQALGRVPLSRTQRDIASLLMRGTPFKAIVMPTHVEIGGRNGRMVYVYAKILWTFRSN
jgi:hypothetical protein